jgi:hypothetical protein
MNQKITYKVGQIWEKEGKQRRIVAIWIYDPYMASNEVASDNKFALQFVTLRHLRGKQRCRFVDTSDKLWIKWTRNASLIKDV